VFASNFSFYNFLKEKGIHTGFFPQTWNHAWSRNFAFPVEFVIAFTLFFHFFPFFSFVIADPTHP
jgi:hypothetical protein